MKKMVLLLPALAFLQLFSLAQDTDRVALKAALQKATDDTVRLRLYNDLADAGSGRESFMYADAAIQLANTLLINKPGAAEKKRILGQQIRSYNHLLNDHWRSGGKDTDKPSAYLQRLLALHTEVGDARGIAETQQKIADLMLFKNDTARFHHYLQKSLEGFEKVMDTANILHSYDIYTHFYLSVGNFPKGLETLQRALSMCKKMRYKKGVATRLLSLADTYRDYGEEGQALLNYQKALPILQELNDTSGIFQGLAALGGFYYKQNKTSKAIETYLQVMALVKSNKDLQEKIPIVHKWMGHVYRDAGEYALALEQYEKSYAFAKGQNKSVSAKENATEVLNGMGDVFIGQGRFAKAADYYLQAAKWAEEINYHTRQAVSYLGVARARFRQQNYSSARLYSHQALDMLRKQFDLNPLSRAELLAAEIDSARGDNREALRHYKAYVRLSNQLRGDEIQKAAQKERYEAEFAQQQALAKAGQEKRDAVARAKLEEEQTKRQALYGGIAFLLVFAAFMFHRFRLSQKQKRIIESQKAMVEKEKRRSDALLLNILPAEVAEELKTNGRTEAKLFDQVTIMFTDFKDFTQVAEKLSPKELVAEIDACFKVFDTIVSTYNIEKIKTIGDSYMCAGGLPVANRTNAVDVVQAALDIQRYMQQLFIQRREAGKLPFEIRIGIHTGPVVAGVVGLKKFAYDIWGDTVNIASRMESSGEVGKVNISGETYQAIKGSFRCIHRGKINAKNKGEIDMYFVEGISPARVDSTTAAIVEKVG